MLLKVKLRILLFLLQHIISEKLPLKVTITCCVYASFSQFKVQNRNDFYLQVAGLVQVHAEMNNFLQSFIEHSQIGKSLKIFHFFLLVYSWNRAFLSSLSKEKSYNLYLFSGVDYLIRDRSLIEALLDLEVTVTTQTGNFLRSVKNFASEMNILCFKTFF